jgi:HAD superfamily phosphoserine phosphatase-like hydrolase
MKKVAIFDIDGTIFRSSLLIEITEALIQEGAFSGEVRDGYKKFYKNWSDRKDSYENYIVPVVNAFKNNIKGVERKVFERAIKKVITNQQNHVYRFTRELVMSLKKKKYYLLAISHSPKEAVEEFCKTLGFDKAYGWIYETDDKERFTGKTLFDDIISDKAKVLKRALEKEGLTLKGSVGVGDSEGDIPFLKLVERLICFNPNKKLYTHAKKAKWEIVVERKDVVYFL